MSDKEIARALEAVMDTEAALIAYTGSLCLTAADDEEAHELFIQMRALVHSAPENNSTAHEVLGYLVKWEQVMEVMSEMIEDSQPLLLRLQKDLEFLIDHEDELDDFLAKQETAARQIEMRQNYWMN